MRLLSAACIGVASEGILVTASTTMRFYKRSVLATTKETSLSNFQSPNQRYSEQRAWTPTPEVGGSNRWQMQTAAEATVAERMGFVRKVYALFSLQRFSPSAA
jgi:hypothetical protein